ncbi:AAA family ATPase [Clostridium botulinum]|uniref:AAA family ATPase n=1 Tax=Clostridium botulinum TaxID=1491 RepID=UPI0006A74F08|nr:AAA family ATPase [Clostridium botulinum]KON09720.1 recombinase RecF [Clostridium botulinum]MBY6907416.1 AAA family ATPase [Clostridium botulinum]MBY6927728.1 AAA family ATPase [Clostridium botulinum]MBY6955110.1 AAA family ATPase [Clostridium botulinum]MCR1178802.1 AAA family ATPase [Clostridium botulinum]
MAKQIILNSLKLKNFKGIKDLTIDFSNITNIFGENGTGKTTIADAFMWLLFDKDSHDRATFEIKTLDNNNVSIHGLEHEVKGVLNIDGKDITLGKIYKEKWTKRRGEAEKQLTGHETLYIIDEVPVKKKEYQEIINNIIDEILFKLITNPLYFSANMKWQERRTVLLDIIGDITTEKIVNYKSDLNPLLELLGDKDIDTLKKSVQARKRKLNEEIKSIPYRVDECNNSIKEVDLEALEFRKRGIISGIKSLEEQLLDSSKVNEEVLKEKDKLYSLKSKLRDMEYKASMEANKPKQELEHKKMEIESNIFKSNSKIKGLEDKKDLYENQVDILNKKADELRNKWFQVNSKKLQFNENEFICPTCKRPFEADDIENKKREMEENFNQDKAKKLSEIQTQGKGSKENIEKVKADIESIKSDIEALNISLSDFEIIKQQLEEQIKNYIPKDPLIGIKEYEDLKAKIAELEAKLQQPTTVNNQVQEIKERKSKLETELEEVNKDLAYKEQNEKLKNRIQELQEKEKKLAQQIAELEGQEYLCEEFIKTKVELLESSINSKFKYVSFKLFDTQVNGGLNETCEALINGVPFSNANTASQINAGLDIINALSEHYSVQAPIFIDNRESINNLIDINSQIINLIVSKDKNLRVEVM